MRTSHALLLVVTLLVLALLTGWLVRAQAPRATDGFWLTNGYGLALELNGDHITIYEVTSISCVKFFDGAAASLELNVALAANQLVITDSGTLHVEAERAEELPAVCANGGTPSTDDPEMNFEIFWHTFNEQYAFFDLYHVDWQAIYDQYRPQVTSDTTPEELFNIFQQMLMPLVDGHISLKSDFETFTPGKLPAWTGGNTSGRIQMTLAALAVIGEHYLGQGKDFIDKLVSRTDGNIKLNKRLFYGSIGENIGYINVMSMRGFAEGTSADIQTAIAQLDEAVAALADKNAIILDVRFNVGGHDGLALAIANRFADQERLAYTKQTRSGDSLTAPLAFSIRPEGAQTFTKPVIVLTSGVTMSAAETLVMAMRTLPQVTVIGEKTAGNHSDVLERHLPNGWQFGLSNEVYTLADGQVYEGVGIPPAVEVSFDAAAYGSGQDVMLDAALQTLTP